MLINSKPAMAQNSVCTHLMPFSPSHTSTPIPAAKGSLATALQRLASSTSSNVELVNACWVVARVGGKHK